MGINCSCSPITNEPPSPTNTPREEVGTPRLAVEPELGDGRLTPFISVVEPSPAPQQDVSNPLCPPTPSPVFAHRTVSPPIPPLMPLPPISPTFSPTVMPRCQSSIPDQHDLLWDDNHDHPNQMTSGSTTAMPSRKLHSIHATMAGGSSFHEQRGGSNRSLTRNRAVIINTNSSSFSACSPPEGQPPLGLSNRSSSLHPSTDSRRGARSVSQSVESPARADDPSLGAGSLWTSCPSETSALALADSLMLDLTSNVVA